MPTKMYPDKDHPALGDLYIRHVEAMTAEGLHSKSDIAAQLAWRDAEIATLQAQNADLLADLQEAAKTLRHYEAMHRAKNTKESTKKAEVNAALATRFEATIAKATGWASS